MSSVCEYSGLPNLESYTTNPQTQADSGSLEKSNSEKINEIYNKLDIDFMYNWIRKHSGK